VGLGLVWGSACISESDSPSSPQDASGTLESATHSPGEAGQIGVGEHMNGFELSGSEGPTPGVWLPDIFWQDVGTLVLSLGVVGTRPQISQRRSGNKWCGQ